MCDSTLACYNSGIDTRDMPNKHLEHPEDLVFDGKRAVLDALRQMITVRKNISVKYDGAPAIVFGTNPDNGRFFVGTKSVFNKKLIKINYTNEDIDQNHTGNVADILRLCLHHLPRTAGITQADWIGVGGGRCYRPNTISYHFPAPIGRDIILAPHTSYTEISPDAVGKCGHTLSSALGAHFINTNNAYTRGVNFLGISARILKHVFKMKMSKDKYVRLYFRTFVNKFIRAGSNPSPETMYAAVDDKYKCDVNVHTFIVWQLMSELKQRLLDSIVVDDDIECFIDGQPTKHEGFVIVSDSPLKIVDRQVFSKANFNLNKNW